MAAQVESEEDAKRSASAKKSLFVATFLAVSQHVITLQSEVMLVKDMVGGNAALAAPMLANTLGLVGILGVILNQIGGKLSDSFGRKPFLAMGPAINTLLGLLVFRNYKKRAVVLPVRVLRMILTTFSGTVMIQTAMADVCSGPAFGVAMSQAAAAIGVSVVCTPMLEASVLQRTGGPKFSYLALSVLGFIHTLWNTFMVPETLEVAKRKSVENALTLSAINPFGFLTIFTRGSVALRKMVAIQTMQSMLEGRNVSDLVEFWKRDHLKWSIEGSRNFVMLYGSLCVLAGVKITPAFLKNLSPRSFTSITNFTNMLGFFLRGSAEKAWVFFLAMPFMLPGVNGASGTALKAISTERAVAEGFGKGEFSAWTNNLRALSGAAATVMIGNYYAWAKNKGVPAGSAFMLVGILGAVVPEIMLRFTRDSEMQASVQK